MPEHVSMRLDAEIGGDGRPFDHAREAGPPGVKCASSRESAQSPFMFVSERGAPLTAALYRAGAAAVQGNFSRLMRAPVSFVACD
jgi:hypothetical protein